MAQQEYDAVSDLSELQKFLDDSYRVSYLDSHVKGSIAYQIQAMREKTGLSQTTFGHLIGQPQSVVSRLEGTEYGGVNINTLLKIANRLGVGLQVRFCNFEVVLADDVSPAALQVQNIQETVQHRAGSASLPKPSIGQPLSGVFVEQTIISGSNTWPTKLLPNQQPFKQFPASETLNFGKSMPMAAS